MIPEEMQIKVDKAAAEVASHLQKELAKELQKKANNLTGNLQQSLKVRVVPSTDSKLAEIRIEFAIHGKYIDIKKLYWRNQPPVQVIKDWLDDGGLIKRIKVVKSVPGYKEGSIPLISQEKMKSRIAWAISMSRANGIRHGRRRKWKSPHQGNAIAHYAWEAARRIGEAVTASITEAITA